MVEPSLLIGDIGGTNARLALADRKVPGYSDVMVLQCADYVSVDVAIRHYVESVGAPSPDVICLAAAGPVVDECVCLTNNSWNIDASELRENFPNSTVRLLNDFVAIAYAIPLLGASDCVQIGLPKPKRLAKDGYAVGVIGAGTGLGTAGLMKYRDLLVPIAGEAGHCGFSPETPVQFDILHALHERFERVSAECLVSGRGLENIYWALSQIRGEQSPRLSAAEIFTNAKDNYKSNSHAAEAVQVFFEVLGQVAGDLALSLGVDDGMYIAGGIAQRYPEMLLGSRFRSGFENKGHHRSMMERVPTQLVVQPEPGLLGASFIAKELLRDGDG